ncbi:MULTISPECIES: molybdopterin-dependent oxidoreductase [unclassified Aureimonas]|uniref:molybdopterin-dependent oxidoreductase n=1 Tax=unclassified Aureimonas TaxID=2615206 RepID=UPI000AAD086E|nr:MULTISPECIES: molybdopterin-dependent oxidoreductase [unclassified Aureimonas]
MPLTRRFVLALAAGATVSGLVRPSWAAELAKPPGKAILRIGGSIGVHNVGEEAVFDVPMLEALGTSRFSTSTPWTDGVATWEGVPLAVLMKAVDASGATIRATALNDYVADIPMAGLAEDGAMLAFRRDGELMPVNNKGPLFVLYPFDREARLQQQSFYMRCAWQVARLDVL